MKHNLLVIFVIGILTSIGGCEHAQVQKQAVDPAAIKAAHLKAHPYCEICGAPATIAHIITPVLGKPENEWLKPNNLISLCSHGSGYGFACHLDIAHGGYDGFYNKNLMKDIETIKMYKNKYYILDHGSNDLTKEVARIKKRIRKENGCYIN